MTFSWCVEIQFAYRQVDNIAAGRLELAHALEATVLGEILMRETREAGTKLLMRLFSKWSN